MPVKVGIPWRPPVNPPTLNLYAWSDRPRLTFVLDTLREVRQSDQSAVEARLRPITPEPTRILCGCGAKQLTLPQSTASAVAVPGDESLDREVAVLIQSR